MSVANEVNGVLMCAINKVKCTIGRHHILWGINPKTENEAKIWIFARITDVGECKHCNKRFVSYG